MCTSFGVRVRWSCACVVLMVLLSFVSQGGASLGACAGSYNTRRFSFALVCHGCVARCMRRTLGRSPAQSGMGALGQRRSSLGGGEPDGSR